MGRAPCPARFLKGSFQVLENKSARSEMGRSLRATPPRSGRSLEQRARLNARGLRELVNHVDRRAVLSTFERAHIGAIDLSVVGQRLPISR
jgi:hypothetical protein